MAAESKQPRDFLDRFKDAVDGLFPSADEDDPPSETPTSDVVQMVRTVLTAHQEVLELMANPLSPADVHSEATTAEQLHREAERRSSQVASMLIRSRAAINAFRK